MACFALWVVTWCMITRWACMCYRKVENPMPDTPVILAFEASADQATAAVLVRGARHAMHHHQARHGHAAVKQTVVVGIIGREMPPSGVERRQVCGKL